MFKKIKNWLVEDKRRIISIFVYGFVVFYAFYVIFFAVKTVNAAELVEEMSWTYEERILTLDNGQEIPLYKDGNCTEYQYCYIQYDKQNSDYCVWYTDLLIVPDSSNSTYTYLDGIKCIYSVKSDAFSYFNGKHEIALNSDRGELVYSNVDIYTTDGNLFFLKAPTPLVIIQTELSGAKIVQKTLQIIGGLIPVLALSVIGFLAFRKGWKLLATSLRQA